MRSRYHRARGLKTQPAADTSHIPALHVPPRPRGRERAGFTMIEIVTVLLLIAILASIAAFRVQSARSAAYMSVLVADLKALSQAQEVYYASSGGYFTNAPNKRRGPSYTKNKRRLGFTPSPDVKVKIRAKKTGWSARAEHKRRKPEKFYCAIYIGDVKPYAPADEEGVITCEPKKKKNKKKKKKKNKKKKRKK